MPRYDGTGPFGDGRPGRGLGPCGRFDGYALGRGYGLGRRRGFGGGYGFRYRAWDATTPYSYGYTEPIYRYSKDDMQAKKAELEKQLQWLNEQLSKEEA